MIVERLSPRVQVAFARFLAALVEQGDDTFFHPHDFTDAAACEIISLAMEGIDEYWVGLENGSVVAYGMLRGWREGYEIPSLGLAVSSNRRGMGLGKTMAVHLHGIAQARGANLVRLTVDRGNQSAVALYTSLGYQFDALSQSTLVGHLRLTHDPR